MITLVPRIEIPSMTPALYIRTEDALHAFTPQDGHAFAFLHFYRTQTRPLDPADPRAVALIEHWASLPGDVAYRVRTRLPRV